LVGVAPAAGAGFAPQFSSNRPDFSQLLLHGFPPAS
jgi:hypothetical protein